MMGLLTSTEAKLDKLHSSITSRTFAQVFTAFVRVLVGLAFIPPSIPKILHKPFTVLPDTNPVGAYFNALYNTGFYYDFLGWSQLTAAVLLLIPRTAHIGSLLFFPIIVNIAVLTNAVGFKGTWLITIGMATAGLYLVAWEYDRLKPILFASRTNSSSLLPLQFITIPAFFMAGAIFVSILFKALGIGNLPDYFRTGVILVVIGAIFGLIVSVHYRFMAVGKLDTSVPD
jgi:hypothetical protein